MVSMTKTKAAAKKPRSLAKGLIAGCIGGLAGVLAKTFSERMFPPKTQAELPVGPAIEHGGGAIVPATTRTASGICWGFGAAAGAVYGALAEYVPAAKANEGASFGVALEAVTSKVALPALALSAEPGDKAGEVASYVVYGTTTEFVRRWVRKVL